MLLAEVSFLFLSAYLVYMSYTEIKSKAIDLGMGLITGIFGSGMFISMLITILKSKP